LKFTDKDRTDAVKKLQKKITDIEREIYRRKKSGQGAAVDSELALVRDAKHPLEGRLPNPYFLPFRNKNISRMSEKVITVSRLDGPSAAVVRRVIDDSLAVEKKGLSGKAYFDARWPRIDEKNLTPYQRYDRAIRNTANLVEKSGRLKVILDEREPLFQPGQAPDASLYCGWYSLGKYVDAFTWKRGAVGYHVASAECTTLKQVESRVWCKSMLEKGVAATLGPVDEPYLDAFPAPEIFFGCLLNGGSLADCYTLSNPFWSWQMILLGDPLYRPFKARRPAAPILFRPAPGH
ncbi:MAG: TIGR03790 family protein, partial [Deltaproteobacteria bacterium]|nr:TIGR03790 family protein [Deltaproteobacteria bacterium]